MKSNLKAKSTLKFILLFAIGIFIAINPAVINSATTDKKTAPAAASKPKNIKVEDTYALVWQKSRPRSSATTMKGSSRISAVAGVRGAKEDQKITPYWKGDKKLPPDLKEFAAASALVDSQKYGPATVAFKEWLVKYPKSEYAPRVKIGLAVCYAYLDQTEDAKKVLVQWLKDYPNNEMTDVVKQFIDELNAPKQG